MPLRWQPGLPCRPRPLCLRPVAPHPGKRRSEGRGAGEAAAQVRALASARQLLHPRRRAGVGGPHV